MITLILVLTLQNGLGTITDVNTVKVNDYSTKEICERKAAELKQTFIGTSFKAITRCI